MASRKVLGNDPFKKGAAGREPVARRPPQGPGGATASPPPRVPTPELQTTAPRPRRPAARPGARPPAATPIPAATAAPSQVPPATPPPLARPPRPRVPATPPRGLPEAEPASEVRPVPHPYAPTATPLPSPGEQSPRPHPNSPRTPLDLLAHAGAPQSQSLGATAADQVAPVAHPNSPTAGSDAADFALAHAGSPDGRGPGLALTPDPATPLATAPAAPTLGEALRGVARAASSVLGLGSRSPQVDGWGKDAILSDALRPLADLVYERYWRVRTSGLEHLPSGPCVLVANHSGALPLDGPLLHRVVRRERPQLPDARWLLEDQLFYAPLLGALANRLGAVRATPENAHRLLDEGRPLIVFPEGIPGLSKPFSERHHLARFGRGGYLKVALRAGVPVIPVAMIGGEESTPLLARLPGGVLGFEYLPLTLPPLPSRWKVRFGAQVLLGGAPPDAEGDPGFFEAKNLEVRDALQGLLDALVAEG